MSKKTNMGDIFVIGFALFAMFFGAGNLIFPPLLGSIAGTKWFIAAMGFVLTGVGMTFLGVVATTKAGGHINNITHKLGPRVGTLMSFLIILCIGPLLAIPRTAATTHEIAFYGSQFPAAITSLIFFAIVLFFTLKPSSIIDAIGKVLTPVLLVILFLLISKGIVSPLGIPKLTQEATTDLFKMGLLEGYQTMDMMASTAFTGIVVASIIYKGYAKDQVTGVAMKSGLVAIIGLAVVYSGLAYLGATYDTGGIEYERVALLVNIAQDLFGNMGHIVLALAISLACLTTSIGLTSAAGQFISKLSKDRISYKTCVIAISIFACVMSVQGVDTIVSFAAPILGVLYPCLIVLLVLAVFDEKIPYKTVYYFSVLGAFIISLPEGIVKVLRYEPLLDFFGSLPLAGLGLNWLTTAIIGGIIGYIIGKNAGSSAKNVEV